MKRYLILLLAVLLALPLIPSTPIFASPAEPGLRVTPLVLKIDIAPGETGTYNMVVGSGAADPPKQIIVEVKGLGQSPDGGFQAVAPGASPFCGAGFIRVSPQEFHLDPGSIQVVEVIVDIPHNAGSGGRYAILHTRPKPPADQPGAAVGAAIATSVVLTLPGQQTREGMITELTANPLSSERVLRPGTGETLFRKEFEVSALFENTGNYHFRAQAEAIFRDGAGTALATASTPLTATSIVPGFSRELKLPLTPEALPPGIYYVEARVSPGDGTVLATRTARVEVSEEIHMKFVSPALPDAPQLPAGINWALVGGLSGGLILVLAALLAYFLAARRKRLIYSSPGVAEEEEEY